MKVFAIFTWSMENQLSTHFYLFCTSRAFVSNRSSRIINYIFTQLSRTHVSENKSCLRFFGSSRIRCIYIKKKWEKKNIPLKNDFVERRQFARWLEKIVFSFSLLIYEVRGGIEICELCKGVMCLFACSF